MFGIKSLRRKRIRERQFPSPWREIVNRNIPYVGVLPGADQGELFGHAQVLLAEKRFEGCRDLVISDEIRVTIAVQAGVLLLHRSTDYFPRLESILVYPDAYVARRVERDDGGVVHEGEEVRDGESWKEGAVVLAWDEVRESASDPFDGFNVVFHEFAHQLDQEDGVSDGTPRLPSRARYREWAAVMGGEYHRLRNAVERNQRAFIDGYGASDPAEFFAVVTECFFEQPVELERRHPRLYAVLRDFYRVDPSAWFK